MNELLAEWQERLFLQAWRIVLRPKCKPDDMDLRDCWGCTDWTEESKTARIDIVDPECLSEKIIPFDFEKTLVHEYRVFADDPDNVFGRQKLHCRVGEASSATDRTFNHGCCFGRTRVYRESDARNEDREARDMRG